MCSNPNQVYFLRGARGRVKYIGWGDWRPLAAGLKLIPGWRGYIETKALQVQYKFPGKQAPIPPDFPSSKAGLLWISAGEKPTSHVGILKLASGELKFVKRFHDVAAAKEQFDRDAWLAAHYPTDLDVVVPEACNGRILLFPYIPYSEAGSVETVLRKVCLTAKKTAKPNPQAQYHIDIQGVADKLFEAGLDTDFPIVKATLDQTKTIPLVAAHGDATPWNCRGIHNGKPVFVDNERATDLPPLYDAFHYHLQPKAYYGGNVNWPELIEDLAQGGDASYGDIRLWLAAYLVHQMALDLKSYELSPRALLLEVIARKLLWLRRVQAPKILLAHQGYELYGSDRVFLQVIDSIQATIPLARITAQISKPGLLSQALEAKNIEISYAPMFVLRKSELKSPLSFLKALPNHITTTIQAWAYIRRFHLVYINSIALVGHILIRRLSFTPAILHIHEIATGKQRRIQRLLIKICGGYNVCISNAVLEASGLKNSKRSAVVWNGLSDSAFAKSRYKAPSETCTNILTIGRFNAWKGQQLLLEAAAKLDIPYKIRLVGSVFEDQEQYLDAIKEKISALQLDNKVEIHDFTQTPMPHYDWANIIVVPSTKPEPFGLTAIEAMARKRPVIASNIGALPELISNRETGLLFEANSSASLAEAITTLTKDPQLHKSIAEAAYKSAAAVFTHTRFAAGIRDVILRNI